MSSPAATMSTNGGAPAAPAPIQRGVEYRCGDCGSLNNIKGGDPVRCRQCGFRILYKIRTKRCEFFLLLWSVSWNCREKGHFPETVWGFVFDVLLFILSSRFISLVIALVL